MKMEMLSKIKFGGELEALGENMLQCQFVHYKSNTLPVFERKPPRCEEDFQTSYFMLPIFIVNDEFVTTILSSVLLISFAATDLAVFSETADYNKDVGYNTTTEISTRSYR
jgi:hypothetical protein